MTSRFRMRRAGGVLAAASLLAAGLPVIGLAAAPAQAVSENVVISQVYGGGGNSGATYTHDFVELFNRGTNTVDLSGMSVQYTSATGTGSFAVGAEIEEELAPGQHYLVQMAAGAGNGVALPTPDATGNSAMAAGAGKVVLVEGTTGLGCNGSSTACSPEQLDRIIDLVGYGNANFFEGSAAAPTLTNSTAAHRGNGGCTDTDDNAADFTAGTPTPRNTTSPATPCSGGPVDNPPVTSCASTLVAPFEQGATTTVSATDDFDGIGAIAITSNAVTGITLEDVDLGAGTAVLTVASSTTPGNYDVVISFSTDATEPQTTTCTVAVTVESDPDAITLISAVQGAGDTSPIAGQMVNVEGIVTSLFERQDVLDGFFVQEEDADWDDDDATSEGVFVFCRGECPAEGDLAVGDQVRVRGLVNEFQGMTQLSSNASGGSITNVSGGNDLPSAVEVALPATGSTRAAPTYESVESMVVTYPGTLVVTEYFELARAGHIVVADERAYQFTHTNEPTVSGYADFIADLNTRRIFLDDDNNDQNDAVEGPENNEPYPWPQGGLSVDNRFRGGDTIEDLTGVMHWSWAGFGDNTWRLRPIDGVDYTFESVNPAPAEPEDVGGRLTVTSYNVLNYFATIDETSSNNSGPCGPDGNQDCRGADSEQERIRQLTKIATGLAEIDADVAGLIEIENDSGLATQQIVDALNGLPGAGTYDAIDTGYIGTDAIKVALIYQPATVTPVGLFEIFNSADDPRFIDTENRPVLIQTFEENSTGERFTIAVNHLKSKGSPCDGDPDILDGQGNCNLTRTAAAEALADFLAGDPTGSGDPDHLIVGDLNSYAKEDPITALKQAGYTDLHAEFEGPLGYSYVFDGQLGYLDTALANTALLPQVTGTTAWHINADEVPLFDYNDDVRDAGEAAFERESSALTLYEPDPLRSSDHDPVIVGLSLGDPGEQVAALRDLLAGMDIHHGIKSALDAKLRAAEQSIARGNTNAACGQLGAFINQVDAQTGKKISTTDAAILREEAVIIRVMLDC